MKTEEFVGPPVIAKQRAKTFIDNRKLAGGQITLTSTLYIVNGLPILTIVLQYDETAS